MKTSYTDKPSFFKWINSYEGELIIKKNQIYNGNGDLLCEFNNGNEQNLLKAAKAKSKIRKALIEYFTEMTKAAGVIEVNSDIKLVYHDNGVYYMPYNDMELNINDMAIDQLFVMGTVLK